MGKNITTNDFAQSRGRGINNNKKKNPILRSLKVAAPIVGSIGGGYLAGRNKGINTNTKAPRGTKRRKAGRVKKGLKLASDVDPEVDAVKAEEKVDKSVVKKGVRTKGKQRMMEEAPLNPPNQSSGMSSGNKKHVGGRGEGGESSTSGSRSSTPRPGRREGLSNLDGNLQPKNTGDHTNPSLEQKKAGARVKFQRLTAEEKKRIGGNKWKYLSMRNELLKKGITLIG